MKKPVVIGLAVVVLAAVVAGGYWWYQSRQDNGLTLEQFLWAWLRSEVVLAGRRVWKAENYYEKAMKCEVKKH